MIFIVDLFWIIFYMATFIASTIIIAVAAVLSYWEAKGYLEEIKQNKADAQILKNAEDFRDDFSETS